MASISVSCPKCEAVLKLAAAPAEGKKVKCPKCAAAFVASDNEVVEEEKAVKAKPDRPNLDASRGRPTRDEDDEDETPRRRKTRVQTDDDDAEDDDRPRRRKGRRDPDEDEDDRPRRSIKKQAAGGGSGMVLALCLGGGALLVLLIGSVVGGFFLFAGRQQVQVAANMPVAQAEAPQAIAPVLDVPAAKKDPEVPKAKDEPKAKPKPKRDPKPKADPMPPPEPPPAPPVPVAAPVDLDKDLLDKTTRATAFIRVDLGNQSARGSGFLVKTAGDTAYIITNYHVIAMDPEQPEQPKGPVGKKGPKGPPPMIGGKKGPGGAFGKNNSDPKARPRVTVVLNSGTPEEQSLTAEVVAVDEESDLAALRVNGARNLPEALDVSQEAALGETQPVYIFGFPAKFSPKGPGNPPITVGKGSISGLTRDANNELIDVQINGEINPGNSGGPVVDAQGRLVGVAVSTVVGKRVGFAIPTGELLQMFKGRVRLGVVYQLKLQGTRVDALGEIWVHDRKSSVRARKNIAVPGIGVAGKGSVAPADEFHVVAVLSDPMLKVSAATAYFAMTENIPAMPGENGWTKLDKATPVALKIQDDAYEGKFRLPKGAVPDQTFAFQFSYVNADKKVVFTQPHLVRLTFPANTKSVTINVAGIPDEATRRYIEDTAPGQFNAKVKVKSKTKDGLVLEVDPVPDPSVIQGQIKFGAVTSVQGRTFEVTANKIALPAPSPAEIDKALEDLKSTNDQKRIAAADRLGKVYVPLAQRRAEVAKALEGPANDKNIWLGKPALRGLLIWGGPENIPAIVTATDNVFTRGEALHCLAKFKDPAAAAALAKWLPSLGDRALVSGALKAMGPLAEKAVIPYVTDKDGWTAREACMILQVIGTAECIPALTEVANSNNNFVNGLARDALKAVQARTKAGG